MTHRAPSSRSVTSALLLIVTAALAAGIFVADILTPPDVVVTGLYVIVVLMATRCCRPPGVVLFAAGCIGLAVVAYFLSPETAINTAIRILAIAATAFLAVERQRAMEALQGSEEQWREVFEHNPVMYFMVGASGTVLSANAFGAAQLGYATTELVGQSVLTVFSEEDREVVKSHAATCLDDVGRPHSWEIRKIRKDGTVLWVRENAKAVQRSGHDAVVLIACEDITERKRGERRMAAAYAVTRVLAEADSLTTASPDMLRAIGENLEWDWGALWSFDWEREQEGAPLRCDCLWRAPDIETTEFATVSRERSFAAGEGLVGQVWRSAKPIWMVDATTEPKFLRAAAAAKAGLHGGVIFPILLDTEALGVVEFFSRAARERDEDQLATLSAIGSQIGQFIKRRRAEAALRSSEERWCRLFETSAAGMALIRLDGIFTAANPALQRMLGRTEEEIVGCNVLELNHEDERAATADAWAKFRSGSLTERHVEKQYLRKDGTPVWLNITTTLVPTNETATAFLQSVYMDITERVRFEAALRASEERWRTVYETAAVGIATLDLGLRYITANAAYRRMTGYTEDELRYLTAHEITHEDDRVTTQEIIDDIAASPQHRRRVEKRYRRKGGETLWADLNTFVVPAGDSTPAFLGAMIVDITDRKRAEEALQQAQADLERLNRVMLLGEMTASIAHEVNQPIAAVITNANAGLRWLGAQQPDVDEARQAFGRIVRDGTRAGEVIGRIRDLVKKVPPRQEFLDINQAIREVIALTSPRRSAMLSVCVSADRVQLQQVMINLIINAIEALAGASGGRREVTIVLRHRQCARLNRRSAGHRSGARSGETRPIVSVLLHHQTRWDWHGPRDQPLDR
jgi:PAS domain S-box-containing protein